MRNGNVKSGQWIAGAGGAALLVSMFLRWYGIVGGHNGEFNGNAFDHPGFLGGVADAVLIAACAVAIGGLLLALLSRAPGIPVAMSAVTTFAGAIAFAAVLGRMILQPGPDELVTLDLWIFVALFAAGAIVCGGWIGMRDDAARAKAPVAPGEAVPPRAPVRAPAPSAPATPAATSGIPAPAAQPASQAAAGASAAAAGAPSHTTGPAATVPSAPAAAAAQPQPQRGSNVDTSKLKPAHWMVGIGGLVLLISIIFFDWYTFGDAVESVVNVTGQDVDTGIGAWDHQGFTGTIANLVILAAAIVALGVVIVRATSSRVDLPLPDSTAAAGAGVAATVMILLRMLFQPGQGEFIDLEWGIYVALIAAIVIAVGGYMWMQEEGTSFDSARDQLRQSVGGGDEPRQPGPPPPSGPPPGGPPPGGPPPQA